jgi:hypothetical protein
VYKESLFLRSLDIYTKATRAPLSPRKNDFFTHEFNEEQISPALSFAFLIPVALATCSRPLSFFTFPPCFTSRFHFFLPPTSGWLYNIMVVAVPKSLPKEYCDT